MLSGKNTKTKLKQLNLPEYTFKLSGSEGSEMILDTIRRKYVKLTPEEWVRQNFLRYLISEGKYPPGLIGVEVMIFLNKLRRRLDILVYNRTGKPVMIVECKEPDVRIDDKVFDQIVSYNLGLQVPYIVVTNGLVHYACKLRKDEPGYEFMNVIPLYEELNAEAL
ncbi:MAG TPA: type I restriction enzyme HsdR N-terminal domain-containing protein [Bacteroidales bacterium]|nr:type I restriction enzyme HsdR N-terminal domain-containing protein [Bacteroidales bacterium]